jgi:hypothetical protein
VWCSWSGYTYGAPECRFSFRQMQSSSHQSSAALFAWKKRIKRKWTFSLKRNLDKKKKRRKKMCAGRPITWRLRVLPLDGPTFHRSRCCATDRGEHVDVPRSCHWEAVQCWAKKWQDPINRLSIQSNNKSHCRLCVFKKGAYIHASVSKSFGFIFELVKHFEKLYRHFSSSSSY